MVSVEVAICDQCQRIELEEIVVADGVADQQARGRASVLASTTSTGFEKSGPSPRFGPRTSSGIDMARTPSGC